MAAMSAASLASLEDSRDAFSSCLRAAIDDSIVKDSLDTSSRRDLASDSAERTCET